VIIVSDGGTGYRAACREATCLQALLNAADARAVGDDAEKLLAESIAVIAANLWHACWDSPAGTYPHEVLDCVGKVAALARARNQVLDEAMSAPDDRHSFLVDQVGWLDALAHEVLVRLLDGLRAMRLPASAETAA
jgi:hypothetical protein